VRPFRGSSRTLTRALGLLLLLLAAFVAAWPDPKAQDVKVAVKVTIYRDDYGVPHIYAATHEAGLYGSGWAQAEDRLEEILKNYLRGTGEMSAAFGEENNFREDVQARMWDYAGVARRNFTRMMPEVQAGITAFVAGINDYMAAHPKEVPAWWGNRRVEKFMPVAFGRQYIWGWPAGQAFGDLRAAGITPSFTVDPRASNEIAVAPSRSKEKVAMLIIDPHLGWFGRQRFWELRLHAGPIHASGFATAGVPYVGLGHTENVAWAHTTGGPDTADAYALTLNPANPLQYKYENGYRELKPRIVNIQVKGEANPREVTFYDSHNGPVVAKKDGAVYVAKIAYAEDVGYIESKYLFNVASNYREAMKALENGRIMPQNVMVADTSGNIYYQRTGKVPIRPSGYDWSRPVDGSTAKTEWLGFHKSADLIQLLNPPQGYMQNCNTPPDTMLVGSPLTSDKYPAYLFNERRPWTHQRAASSVRWLEAHRSISVEEFMALAVDTYNYQYDRWVEELVRADEGAGVPYRSDADYQAGLQGIREWDGYSNAASAGALKYYYWRHALDAPQLSEKINDYLELIRKPKSREQLSETEQKQLVEALVRGMKTMRANHGRMDAVFGDVFRVGRDEKSWPVGGGSLTREGMATLRAVNFGDERADHTRWGQGGQTSTEVVVLSKPIRSYTQPPIGQSDRKDSPHYRDQAEELFSPARLKPTWFARQELMNGHVKSKVELNYPGNQ